VLPEKMGEAVELMASLWLGPRAASEEDRSQRVGEALDRSAHYLASRITHGLSPMAVAEAFFDWMIHLSASPGKQLQLAEKAARKSARLARRQREPDRS
jgi:polyhydroxyalkanoate synthase